ncbi:MAG: hypothetical protein ACI8W8_000126 [Rhodothermales bacterium]|jgi:hypothetical protein
MLSAQLLAMIPASSLSESINDYDNRFADND